MVLYIDNVEAKYVIIVYIVYREFSLVEGSRLLYISTLDIHIFMEVFLFKQ